MSSFTGSQTRSHVARNHAVFAPESHVPASISGWSHTQAVILMGPRIGAKFAEYIVTLSAGATSAMPAAGIQRFALVLEGTVELNISQGSHALNIGSYVYVPAGLPHTLTCASNARLLLIEKPYVPVPNQPAPQFVIGREQDMPTTALGGNPDLQVKPLLPAAPGFDMAVNIMAFEPGAALGLVEVHIMEHGLFVLDGQFIYRLDEQYYPVQAGDAIYMAPFCPQWCAAFGKQPARYLLYKDWNHDPFGY